MKILTITLVVAAGLAQAQTPDTIPLWENRAPGALGDTDADRPTLTIFRAAARQNPVTSVIVAPGGGYLNLSMDKEGRQVASWFNAMGVTAFVLKYRLGPRYHHPIELGDAQRAIRLVRSRAMQFGVAPDRIGMMGFSAGGHLVAATSTLWPNRVYAPVDAADKVSCRPDFAVAVYAGHFREHTPGERTLSPYLPVTRQTPPTFILHAIDDPVDPVEGPRVYYAALKKAGVPVEMHLFAHGGHAFGLRRTKQPITAWPELVEKWLRKIRMTQ